MTALDLSKATISTITFEFIEFRLTPTEFLEFCIDQITKLNPKINAVLDLYEKEARVAALASTERYKAGKPLSYMDGIPVGVKANIAVQGHVWHGGIKAYNNNIADRDAEVVRRLREAGAIILGSLNMEEGALGAQTDNPWFGKTQNPLKHGYTPGGSSGGSAAVVASGMMPAALGTDTMGSVRIPSAYCGIVGYKPTNAAVSLEGVMPLSPMLDTVGPHTRSIRDAGIVFEIISGQTLGGQDFGFDMSYLDVSKGLNVEQDVLEEYEKSISNVKAKIFGDPSFIDWDFPALGYDFGKVRRAGLLISEIEGAAYHKTRHEMYPDGFSEEFWNMMEWGLAQTQEKVDEAYNLINTIRREDPLNLFRTQDFLITPTAPQVAFKFGENVPTNQADITAIANVYGSPAISFPIGVNETGLPISLQVIGPPGGDEWLFASIEWIQNQLIN